MATTIPTLPPAPSRANDTPEQFSNKADALLGALSGFVTAANAQAGENNTAATNAAASAASAGTSASSATASASSATASQTAAAISASAAEAFAQQASGTAISSGTANAVAYLDSNKYLKATSDLTYNGSQLGVPPGTVSTPSLTTTGDANTGVYFPAADTVGIATGGTQRIVVDSAGNVGVATGSPTAKLHVEGGALIDGLTVGKGGGGLDTNTASGRNALYFNTTGNHNTANGAIALYFNTTGNNNTASGRDALFRNTTGNNNTGVGFQALFNNTTSNENTGVGFQALSSNSTYSNCSGLGNGAQVSGSNQVQLGNSETTTYVYGSVANRSDARDKADVRDTQLGLQFIMGLRPVDYKWDYREDYRPERPAEPAQDATDEEKAAHKQALDDWIVACKPENIVKDGSKTRIRYHHGVIAQEVKTLIDAQGVDFGGYQDHTANGGEDVLTLGYLEFIAPIIKAIQEQQAIIKTLSDRIAALEAK